MKGNSVVENAIQSVNEHLKGNRLGEAIEVLSAALRAEPNNLDLVYLLGICYIFNAAYEDAIAIFEGMLRGKPKKNIYLLLSVCYKKTERFEQTEQIVTRLPRSFSSASTASPNTTRPTSTAASSTSNSRTTSQRWATSTAPSPSTPRSRSPTWARATACG